MYHFNYWNLPFVPFVDKQKEAQTLQMRKWKPCKVKDILANLQRHFEQYNAYHSLNKDSSEQGKTSEQTGI